MKPPPASVAKQVIVDSLVWRGRDGGSEELAAIRAAVDAYWLSDGGEVAYREVSCFGCYQALVLGAVTMLAAKLGLHDHPHPLYEK